MSELYKAIAGSPITYLATDVSAGQTTIAVTDDSVLPDAPNICTIGYGENIETIRYGAKSNGVLQNVTRGLEGTPRAWKAGTEVARFYTAYEHNAIVETIESHLADYATITSMEFPFDSGVTKANTARITKIGKVVSLTIGVKKSDGSVFAQGSSLIIGQLPAGYRPSHSIIIPAGLGNDEWRIHNVGYVYIGTDGRIQVANHVNNTAKVIYFSTSYIVN